MALADRQPRYGLIHHTERTSNATRCGRSALNECPYSNPISRWMGTLDNLDKAAVFLNRALVMLPAAIQLYTVWRETPNSFETLVTPPANSTAASTIFTL